MTPELVDPVLMTPVLVIFESECSIRTDSKEITPVEIIPEFVVPEKRVVISTAHSVNMVSWGRTLSAATREKHARESNIITHVSC